VTVLAGQQKNIRRYCGALGMRTSSAKAKGRRCAQEVVDLLYKYAKQLDVGDCLCTSSGCTGEDVLLSPKARQIYPLAIECKNQESLNIWSALKQADSHVKEDLTACVFFKRNHSKLYVALDAEAFILMLSDLDNTYNK
jgi:hypothetical protein